MQIREIMSPKVEVIRPDALIREAAQKMKELDVGCLPVCDGERLAGMVTDRDITLRATAEGRDPNNTRVDSVMSPHTAYCFEDQDVTEAAKTMEDRQIRRLIVLNRDKRLVGIASLGDLAVKTHDEHLMAEALEQISEPAHA